MKDDKFLEGQLEDKIRLAADKYIVTYSGFLDAHARAVAERVIKGNNLGSHIELMFWGGYEDAESSATVTTWAPSPDLASNVTKSGTSW